MALPCTPISQLCPTPVPAKIRVRIGRLWAFEKADRPGEITGYDMILVDEQGTKIQASMGKGLIWKHKDKLEEGACRLFMNFKLLPNNGPFKGTSHPYRISIQYSSVIKEATEIPNLSYRFSFHPFNEIMSSSHDTTVFFDVIGEIVAMSELEDVKVGDRIEKTLRLKLQDHGDIIIDCTLWSKFALEAHSYLKAIEERPVVLIGSLMKTRKFNGKTTVQSNPFATKLFFSSEIDEIKKFKECLGSSDAIVPLSQTSGSLFSGESALESFPSGNYQTISQILAETEDKICVTIATIESFSCKEAWWYIGCNGCFKIATPYFNAETEMIEHDKHSCGPCNKEITNTSFRYMLKMRAADETEAASFVLFDRVAALLIQKSAYALRQEQIEFNREGEYPQELLDLVGMTAVLKIKIKSSDQGFSNTSYQVLKISVDQSEIQRFRQEMTKDGSPYISTAANSLSSVPSTLQDVQIENTASETGEHEVLAEPFTPVQKRPLAVVVVDQAAEASSNKRGTPQSVNKPRVGPKVFVKKEKKH